MFGIALHTCTHTQLIHYYFASKFYETMVVLQLRFLLVPFLTSVMGAAQYMMQDAALMNYIDRRFLSLEVCASCIIL